MTQAILLGAGRGSRIGKLSKHAPKWLLELDGQSLAQHLVNVLHFCNITQVSLVRRDPKASIHSPSVQYFVSDQSRNMTETLYNSRGLVNDDVIILYCDLLIEPKLIEIALKPINEDSVLLDRSWQNLFRLRAEDPLSIAESCKLDGRTILDLGQPLSTGEIPDAQYIGIMHFRFETFQSLMRLYEELRDEYAGKRWRNSQTFEAAYLTDFIQEAIERGLPIKASFTDGGWLEFDTPSDYRLGQTLANSPTSEVFDFSKLPRYPSVLSAGGLASRTRNGVKEVLLVGSGKDNEWRIPKGMLDPGEAVRVAAKREVYEETGVRVSVEDLLSKEEWHYDFDGQKWWEQCYFFRLTPKSNAFPVPDQEHAVAAWLPIEQAAKGLMFASEANVLSLLLKNPSNAAPLDEKS